jgi:hypothetical protein
MKPAGRKWLAEELNFFVNALRKQLVCKTHDFTAICEPIV